MKDVNGYKILQIWRASTVRLSEKNDQLPSTTGLRWRELQYFEYYLHSKEAILHNTILLYINGNEENITMTLYCWIKNNLSAKKSHLKVEANTLISVYSFLSIRLLGVHRYQYNIKPLLQGGTLELERLF